jgi:hypothetical protein
MKMTQIALGAATLIVLAAQSATPQTAPPLPEQPAPVQPTTSPPTSAQPAAPSPAVVYTTVNLRQGPGTNYNIVAKIPAGNRIDVESCGGQWCQVTFQGQNGYVIATSLDQGGAARPLGGTPPPGAGGPVAAYPGGPPPPPPGYNLPGYYASPPYYGPYPYGYYGYGPYYGGGYGYYGHRHW